MDQVNGVVEQLTQATEEMPEAPLIERREDAP
jgi:hypothetical protein